MKRLLMILFILVLTAFSVSVISCGSDETPDSDTPQDTSSDTTENFDNQYVKNVSGDYWYCDSIIVSEDPSYYFMSGDKGDAGVFSDFALQSHGSNIYTEQTNYLVCSIKYLMQYHTQCQVQNIFGMPNLLRFVRFYFQLSPVLACLFDLFWCRNSRLLYNHLLQ